MADESIAEKLDQLEKDISLTHDIVHGDDRTSVSTENGLVPSHAKAARDGEQAIIRKLQPTVEDINGHADYVSRQVKEADTIREAIAVSEKSCSQYAEEARKGAEDAKNIKEIPVQNGKTGRFLSTDGHSVSWQPVPDELPSQQDHAGKVLGTDGATLQWQYPKETPNELPDKTGKGGRWLKTDGSAVSWQSLPEPPPPLPEQDGQAGKVLGTDGSQAVWQSPKEIPEELPPQSGQGGKWLKTDGNHPQWQQLPDPPEPLPEQNNNGGKFLSTNGSQAQWQKIHDLLPPLPDQDGHDNKVLMTDGTTSIWRDVSAIVAIPVGVVILFYNSGTLPDKWLECNGQSFNAVLYPKLSKLLGKNTVPNFREVENQRYIIKADDSPNIEVDEPTRVTADTIAAKVQAINHEVLDFGTVSKNSRYVKDNPFGESPVLLFVEVVKYSVRTWFSPGWYVNNYSRTGESYGVRAGRYDNNTIVIQTGTAGVTSSLETMTGASADQGTLSSAGCRVHVWQVGV
ncbi:hypothetical protein CI610_00359 [invertebrate metagenome]|uniref:Phage tail collar domain-containing protein n=1 Tax=invertebrate metagenome TaxID=1711999 RepID=A0A2H9TC53_9ZZZZ